MHRRDFIYLVILSVGVAASAIGFTVHSTAADKPSRWWAPGEGRIFPAKLDYRDESGVTETLLTNGPLDTKGHPFFTAIGPNGRACVTCHQPADGMSLSVKTIQERWKETDGKDPLFAAYDGSNCPNLRQDEKKSHSLLLERGAFPSRDLRGFSPADRKGRHPGGFDRNGRLC